MAADARWYAWDALQSSSRSFEVPSGILPAGEPLLLWGHSGCAAPPRPGSNARVWAAAISAAAETALASCEEAGGCDKRRQWKR